MNLLSEKEAMKTRESNQQTTLLGYPSFGGAEDQRVKIFSERG